MDSTSRFLMFSDTFSQIPLSLTNVSLIRVSRTLKFVNERGFEATITFIFQWEVLSDLVRREYDINFNSCGPENTNKFFLQQLRWCTYKWNFEREFDISLFSNFRFRCPFLGLNYLLIIKLFKILLKPKFGG